MSKEQQAQAQPQVAIPLPKAKKNLVQIGCICMMLSVAMYGLVFATLTAPILEKVDAMGYVGLFSIVGAIGVSIMTPIGGKLGDLIGRRNIADFGIGIRNIVYLGVQFIELIVRICTCPFLHQLTHFGDRNDLIQLLLGKTKGQSQICIRIHIGRQNVFSLFRV